MMQTAALSAHVVCGRGVRNTRGELLLSDGKICLRLDGKEEFHLPVSSLDRIVWHWYSFSAALETRVNGKSYFLSFIPRSPSLNQWYRGLMAGRYWRAVLEGRTPPRRGPIAAGAVLVLWWLTQPLLILLMGVVFMGAGLESASSGIRFLAVAFGLLVAVYFVFMLVTNFREGRRLLRETYP